MKKLVFAFSLVLFTASLALATAAQQDAAAQKAAKTVNGEVLSIDLAKNEVVVKDATGKEVRLLTDGATKVTQQGKEIALAELKPNQRIAAEYEEATNGYLAKAIRVAAAKADNK